MDFDWTEWLNIALRWTHVFAGIMWIGQTYFFTWLEGRFHELATASNKGEQHIWMVHSGGFYVVEKQLKPKMISQTLHWFKWEAAITWLSGVALLILVYYAGGLLVDSTYDELTSIIAGVGIVVAAWMVYDILWNSQVARNEPLAVGISFALSVAAIYVFSQLFGGRTAYMHVGAMYGTLMTANVWMRILPAQRKMVAALQKGDAPDMALADRARTRSKHNTFMVVPVVFTMISSHYPTVSYGSEYGWVVLSALVMVGWVAAKFIRKG